MPPRMVHLRRGRTLGWLFFSGTTAGMGRPTSGVPEHAGGHGGGQGSRWRIRPWSQTGWAAHFGENKSYQ